MSYWREYRTQFHIVASYGIHESSANRIIRRVENLLIQSGRFKLPKKREVQETDWVVVIVDATESPIECPKKNRKSSTQARKSIIAWRCNWLLMPVASKYSCFGFVRVQNTILHFSKKPKLIWISRFGRWQMVVIKVYKTNFHWSHYPSRNLSLNLWVLNRNRLTLQLQASESELSMLFALLKSGAFLKKPIATDISVFP